MSPVNPLLRQVYRWLKPTDPGGWIQYRTGSPSSDRLDLYTVGMASIGRSDLLIAGIPSVIKKEAEMLLHAIAKISENELLSGKVINEKLLASRQPCLHRFSIQDVRPVDSDQKRLLGIVDPGRSGFPIRLVAAHLVVLGDHSANPVAAEGYFKRSIEVFPGDEAALSRDVAWSGGHRAMDPVDDNENNCLAYYGLANALGDQGSVKQAMELMHECIKRSPQWARNNQERIRATIPAKEQKHIVDPLARFWLDTPIPG